MTINISYSLLADFLSCQRKPMYRIQHPELAVPNKEMTIGSAIHMALEKFSNNKEDAIRYALEYLTIRNVEGFADSRYTLDCIENFFRDFRPHLTEDDLIEVKFRLPIINKNTLLVGKIDRISDNRIFDWKTHRNPPSRLFNDLQFIIYEWAYAQMYGEAPKASYYGALSTGKLIPHGSSGDAENYVFEEIIPQVIYNIKHNIYPHTGVFARACYRCPYRDTCLKDDINVVDSGVFTKK